MSQHSTFGDVIGGTVEALKRLVRDLIRSFRFAHPSGFPSMSSAPTGSILEDFEAVPQKFATMAV
jgi:hypothetical protein